MHKQRVQSVCNPRASHVPKEGKCRKRATPIIPRSTPSSKEVNNHLNNESNEACIIESLFHIRNMHQPAVQSSTSSSFMRASYASSVSTSCSLPASIIAMNCEAYKSASVRHDDSLKSIFRLATKFAPRHSSKLALVQLLMLSTRHFKHTICTHVHNTICSRDSSI